MTRSPIRTPTRLQAHMPQGCLSCPPVAAEEDEEGGLWGGVRSLLQGEGGG